MVINNAARLHEQLLAAGIPVVSVCVTGNTGTIIYADSATALQRQQGQTILNNFDWSQSACDAWDNLKQRADALTRLDSREGDSKLLRAVEQALLDEVNILRQIQGLQARTVAQIKTVIQNKLSSGKAD